MASRPTVSDDAEAIDVGELFGLDSDGIVPAVDDQVVSSSSPPAAEPAVGDGVAASPEPAVVTPPVVEPAPTGKPPEPIAPLAPAPAPAAIPPVAPEALTAPSEDKLRANALEAQLAAAQARLTELEKPKGQPGQPAAPAAPGNSDEEEAPPSYRFELPEQVAQLILSEEPQDNVKGITTLINGLATVIHANVRKEFQTKLSGVESRIRQSGETTQADTAREQMRSQYFAKFQAHNDPVVHSLVASEATKLAAEFPGLPWNDDYINALGSRVNTAIAKLTGVVAPVVPTTSMPAAPAPMMPSTPRSGAPGTADTQADEIAELFAVD